jgi:hypothetical protein
LDVAQIDRKRAARLLFQLPRECRLFAKLSPSTQWGWAEVFANKTNYLLELLLWQNSFDPKKKQEHRLKRPTPFVPDFMKPSRDEIPINKGIETHELNDVGSLLNLPRV